MSNPTLKFELKGNISNFKKSGKLASKYQPLYNLVGTEGLLKDFTTDKLLFDNNKPIDIEVLDSYDGSVNLILNDDHNKPRLINTRFSVAEDNTYIIPDHTGNKDTNLYQEDALEVDTYLQKTISKIPKLSYEGLSLGGQLSCGTYHFYFTFCDNDGNETDFVAESSAVMVHIGNINDPFSIRMGMENEKTDKAVRFKMSNIDTAYDFVKVYYTKATAGSQGVDINLHYRITTKFPILNWDNADVIIYGSEPVEEIDSSVINLQFEYCSKVKAAAACQNRLFLGNVWRPNIPYEELKEISLLIYPSISQRQQDNIGSMDNQYYDLSDDDDHAFGYYNTKNIYYRTGYWPEEYYRFGIVYIMNDYTLSPVFNIRGIDLCNNQGHSNANVVGLISYNEDGYVLDDSGAVIITENNFGVTRIPHKPLLSSTSKPIGIKFNICDNHADDNDDQDGNLSNYHKKINFLKDNCKGYFFVRLDRIPITIALGLSIGKTMDHYGNLPVIKNESGSYFSESFLNDLKSADGLNLLESSYVSPLRLNVEIKAALVPDACLRTSLFNLIFCSKECKFNVYAKSKGVEHNGFLFSIKKEVDTSSLDPYALDSALFTMVNTGIKLTTNGKDYFSAKAGEAEDIKLVESIVYDWRKTGSYVLSSSTNACVQTKDKRDNAKRINLKLSHDKLVRGLFGTYVGISDRTHITRDEKLEYGDIINIKDNSFAEDQEHYYLAELIRKQNSSPFFAISDRLDLDELFNGTVCYRGDCFICVYTHRMIRNFIDRETPTNDKIVNPTSWNDNFLVLTTFKTSLEGTTYYVNEILPLFKARKAHGLTFAAYMLAFTAMIIGIPSGALINKKVQDWMSLESDDGINWDAEHTNDMFICLPSDSKYAKLGNFGELIGVPNTWYEFGTNKINRSDVNAVGLGHWISFRILSNNNLCMRDEDFWLTEELSVFNNRRSFYPLRKLSRGSLFKIAESDKLNTATNNILSSKNNWILPDVPYTKQQYDTRIQYSDVTVSTSFGNGFRVFRGGNYIDLPKTYGCLVEIIEWHGNLICVMEHGVLKVAVNERSMAGSGDGGDIYINSNRVLSTTPVVISSTFGSTWKESVVVSDNYIYGVDTCGKKIWRTDGSSSFECISDFHLQKFLNDNIDLQEWEDRMTIGVRNVKTHYNNFKKDIMFTFYNDDIEWNICWNEMLKIFTTFYSWTPSYSDNINNIYISFDEEDTRNVLNAGTEMIDKYYDNAYDDDTANINLLITLNVVNSKETILQFNDRVDLIESDYLKYPDNIYFTISNINNSYELKFNSSTNYELVKNEKYLDVYVRLHQLPKISLDQDAIKIRIKNPLFNKVYLWKHGLAGLYDGQGEIKPTTWYGRTYPFEFECVVSDLVVSQKIFNNLMIISNKTQPEELQYEIVGESYEWFKYKPIIDWANDKCVTEQQLRDMYKYLLTHTLGTIKQTYSDFPGFEKEDTYVFRKLPYIRRIHKNRRGDYEDNSTELRLIKDDLMNEERLNIRQECNDIKKYGRLKGNIEYKEDEFRAEIRHINFKYAYIDSSNNLRFTKDGQSRIRDKYVKIRVRYSGYDLAVVQALKTLYSFSYA